MPFNIWTIGHVVQDCFCDDAAITTTAAKPRTKIKGHFDGFLFIYNPYVLYAVGRIKVCRILA
jgi:hypothetical protein